MKDYKVTNEDLWGMVTNIFNAYPEIKSLKTHEDARQAIIRLDLGGFKRGKAITYSYS